ncbi:MAG: thiamine pyrophosphate-dependent dehydrogenase E1 component subunit alpha, partial [Chloroflexi bacterium]|nr:thiamine pyrophosphate-dependent dehydrogenase E1 component subunit alpha [Chloroflexota bacterium]
MTLPNLIELYRYMFFARLMDERMWDLIRQGKGHFAVPSSGHESIAAIAFALDQSRDYLVPHYRDLAALLAWGVSAREIFCHFFARANDPMSGGRQMFAHWGHARLRVLSVSSPQPNQVTHAVGIAFAAKYRAEKYVTWCGFGEGGSSKGDVHESMNFAAIHKLPIVFCVENNRYAISVPQNLQMAVDDVAPRADGYGMPGVVVDGSDPRALYAAAKKAVDRARRGEGPTLIEMKCYRYLSHTSNDDHTRYRAKEEVAAARKKDPVMMFKKELIKEKKWSE